MRNYSKFGQEYLGVAGRQALGALLFAGAAGVASAATPEVMARCYEATAGYIPMDSLSLVVSSTSEYLQYAEETNRQGEGGLWETGVTKGFQFFVGVFPPLATLLPVVPGTACLEMLLAKKKE